MAKAQVESVESLKSLKVALVRFIEAAGIAMAEADSDLSRTKQWLDLEQDSYWNNQARKAQELLSRAEDALRMKRLFKDSAGHRQSTVDEEKAVKLARARLELCVTKIAAVKRWKQKLDREAQVYKGSVARFSTTLAADLPAAVSRLENYVRQIEAYIGHAPVSVASSSELPSATGRPTEAPAASMARPDETVDDAAAAAEPSVETPTTPATDQDGQSDQSTRPE
jgi:hypothetical protein